MKQPGHLLGCSWPSRFSSLAFPFTCLNQEQLSMNAYEKGRLAYHKGVNLGANPYPPGAAFRDWNIGWKCESELSAEREKAMEAANRLRNVVDAIEAFTDAKVQYALNYAKDSAWASLTDVNETREHLTDKLAELINQTE
jgi:hypothetical protein